MSRIGKLAEGLEEPLLVTSPTNIRYLTGFASSNPALLVRRDGGAQLFSDFRYAEAGRAVLGVEFVEIGRSLLGDLAGRLEGRVGFEAAHLSYAGWEALAAGKAELVPRRGLVEALRAVKDESELETMRRASAITTAAYERLAAEPFIGRTELDLAWRLQELFHELGADGLAFDPIVATGPNGARPHADPGDRTIEPGQLVTIDMGCSLDGYASDCTRTFSTGRLSDELQDAYALCLRAELAGLDAICSGVSGRDADGGARAVIEAAGLGAAFGHGLGHGVGLEVHEAPTLRRESEDVLATGNVVSCEPGIYLEGRGGVRIEDLVVVREGEPEILTGFTKELVEVG